MARFVLIHGAWHGAWCWEPLVTRLRAAGHAVLAPDLPGHGADAGRWWRATLGGYAGTTLKAARELGGEVIAVGHSLGGVAMTEAAARDASAFVGLIYVCAFAPLPGENLVALASRDPTAGVPGAVQRGPLRTRFIAAQAPAVFYNACPPAVAAAATARLIPQPNLPLLQRVSRAAGPVPPRAYIECLRDRAITPAHQRWMRERAGIDRVIALDTDHSPFMSATEDLAAGLERLAQEFATLGSE